MASRETAAKAAASKGTAEREDKAANAPASLFNYYSDLAAANAEMMEQGMRLMGGPLKQDAESVNGMLDGFSLGLKLMEQYQEFALAQFEAITELQTQLWQGLWAGSGEAASGNPRSGARRG